jgi:hypothetical protein
VNCITFQPTDYVLEHFFDKAPAELTQMCNDDDDIVTIDF